MLLLDHVQIAMPVGQEDEARGFFGDLLGLTEIEKPAELKSRGGCWFALGDRQLHLGIDSDFRAVKKAHIALATDNLAELRARLSDAGCVINEDAPIEGRRRFFSEDPFGNRLEVLQLDPTE